MEKKNGNIVAIITMIFLFGMVGFVTNLAAPVGNIWKMQPGIDGSNTLGMMGNMMNFLAYLFMGIPAGKLLYKYGSKKTILLAISVGFLGVFIQFLSGVIGVKPGTTGIPASFYVYLLGAFVSGFSVCMLNTVVNPMLTLLGGGGNKGNQFVQIGGTFNSLMGTLTPMLVGVLVGEIVAGKTQFADINLVLYIAMGVFLVAGLIISTLKLVDPETNDASDDKDIPNPWKYRHFILGVVAIFVYVGTEVGIPGTLNFFLSDSNASGLDPKTAAATAGFVAGTYWFLMLIGRFLSSLISSKVSSRVQLGVTTAVACALLAIGMFAPASVKVSMPVFTGSAFAMETVPLAALLFVLCGLCTSVMWGAIFNLSVQGLGKATTLASGIFMMMVVGGGILPLIQNFIVDHTPGYMIGYIVPLLGMAYMCFYAWIGSKPKAN